MTALRVLIVDDEPIARAKLKRLLTSQSDVEMVGEATNGEEAVSMVRELAPELLFLDIRMPLLDGFQALGEIAKARTPMPKIVFVTAYDEYAVRAFEVRAFDYVLKPFDRERLVAALDRVRAQVELEHRPDPAALSSMVQQLSETTDDATPEKPECEYLSRFCIRSAGRVQLVPSSEVEWIEAYGNYVRLHTSTSHPLFRETLRNLTARLDPAHFCRVHRSAIVNIDSIREMRPCVSGDYLLRLASGTRIRLSRTYRPELDRRTGRR
jgi:two-component system LytT family response regulator